MNKLFWNYLIRTVLLAGLGGGAFACQSRSEAPAEIVAPAELAQAVVDSAIAVHGMAAVSGNRIEFDFRNRHYVSERRGWRFTYERIFTDSTGRHIRDVLSNNGLLREIDGMPVSLPAEDSAAYARSVNSVIYFALLPYYLNDRAVVKEYLGEVSIKGQPYHKVKVTFRQEGGGRDFEDEYIYWFHRDRHTMDYVAYNYQVDGGGARFREAYNVRTVGGIRFADYINYEPTDSTLEVATFDHRFTTGGLKELSRIETQQVQVSPLTE